VLAYLRGTGGTAHTPGHSPLGALSVLGLLAVVGFQAVSGLFTNDDIAFEGPLSARVSGATASLLTTLHRWNEKTIIALVALHLAAILYYRFGKRRDLVGPMLSGDAEVHGAWPASRDDAMLWLRALVIAAACGAAGAPQPRSRRASAAGARRAPRNPAPCSRGTRAGSSEAAIDQPVDDAGQRAPKVSDSNRRDRWYRSPMPCQTAPRISRDGSRRGSPCRSRRPRRTRS
jgi:hypothetical protein